MKKYVLIIASIILILFSSCNPDSNFSILYNKLHAKPTSDYRISTYVGDLDEKHIVLGTDKGITIFDLENMKDTEIAEPIVRPILLARDSSQTTTTYVLYYKQNYGKDASLKARAINPDYSVGDEMNAIFQINGTNIDVTTVYRFANQKTGEDAYTIQEREITGNDADEERTINFHHYTSSNNCGYTISVAEGVVTINYTGTATKASVSSNSSVAPYIVGDGYVAYLDENESYNIVYDVAQNRDITRGTTPADYTCPDNEIIAFFDFYNDNKVMVDNSGNIYINDQNQNDYGSFPMDNRRSAYSTIVGNELFIGYKYGPEILSVNNEGNITSRSTSDINDEDILGFKFYNNNYYVVTEEASVIRTSF